METNTCLLRDVKYKSGELVCEETRCFVCKDGNWEEGFADRAYGIAP
jgi:hypothetical protein